MKFSKYNFFVESDELDSDIIAYNALSNSLALISRDKYKKYLDFEKENKDIDDKELIDDLYKGCFLIDDSVNEIDSIRFSMYKDRFETGKLALTLAPTMDCDFRCVYCYEKGKNDSKHMSLDTQQSIIALIDEKKDNLDQLNIVWYGGEPLLAIDIIENLSTEIIKICEENNIVYDSYIVTNGYGLTRDICEKFKKCNITAMQITIDGPAHIHDTRRILVDGKPTYKKIIDNIVECKDLLPRVALRINVDKNNVKYLDDLLKEFNENNILDSVNPYLGHVRNTNDCYSDNTCLSIFEYSEVDYQFDSMLHNYGVPQNILKYLPKRVTAYCGADYINSHTVDPNGDLYRCWSDIGNLAKRVGNINKRDFVINKNITDFMLFDATTTEKCRNCKVLPLCMGGCPIKEDKHCNTAKFMLDTYLKQVAKNVLESRLQNV
ncbi:MAG: radical SAM protein [Paraclostridium sp.]